MATPVAVGNLSNVLPFPIQNSCPCCTRVCAPDDLTTCNRCGERWCGRTGCPSTCGCDRFAVVVMQNIQRMNPSLWRRALNLVREI